MDINDIVSKIEKNLMSVVILVVAVFVALHIFKMQKNNIEQLNTQIASEKEKNVILSNICVLEKKFADIKNKVNCKNESDILNNLGNLVKEAGVKISSLRPSPTEDTSLFKRYAYELTVTGNSYHVLGKFIGMLENSPDIYTIENFAIRKNSGFGGQDNTDKLAVNLLVSTILVKE